MAKENDPQLYSSGYERNRLDRYWTSPWMTNELVKYFDLPEHIWECAAGRGDMSLALRDAGHEVHSSDIDMGEFDYDIGQGHERSFLDEVKLPPNIRAIVTNPPYSEPWRGIADDFVEHAISLLEASDLDDWIVAMLLRSEFKSGKSKRRQAKFGDCPHYWGELVLTTRPRWDLGDPDRAENVSPRHNSSWFVWRKNTRATLLAPGVRLQRLSPASQIFSYMPKGFKP